MSLNSRQFKARLKKELPMTIKKENSRPLTLSALSIPYCTSKFVKLVCLFILKTQFIRYLRVM